MQKNIALFNISKKMQLYLLENQLSILKLAQKIPDIKYQTLKRIIEFDGEGSLPNIASLMALADFFNCSIAELLNDKITITINCYLSINDFCLDRSNRSIKLKMPIDEYYLKRSSNIFAINNACLNTKDTSFANDIIPQEVIEIVQIFAKISTVEYEGYYIVEIDNTIKVIKVISVSSQNLMTEHDGQIINIATSNVKILAKFINNSAVIADWQKLLIANR